MGRAGGAHNLPPKLLGFGAAFAPRPENTIGLLQPTHIPRKFNLVGHAEVNESRVELVCVRRPRAPAPRENLDGQWK